MAELRALSEWSEGHVWCSPEMHGCLTGAFKNQIDWLPLNTGSVRPTQGRTCLVMQNAGMHLQIHDNEEEEADGGAGSSNKAVEEIAENVKAVMKGLEAMESRLAKIESDAAAK